MHLKREDVERIRDRQQDAIWRGEQLGGFTGFAANATAAEVAALCDMVLGKEFPDSDRKIQPSNGKQL